MKRVIAVVGLASVLVVQASSFGFAQSTTRADGRLGKPAPGTVRVTFLGTGCPRPSFERYGPSTLVEAGDHRVLIDPSWGLRERLMQAGSFELLTSIDSVLLTHLHYDHTVGLPDLWLTGWLYGRRVPLKVRGPRGTRAFVDNFERAYRWDIDYRILVKVPRAGSEFEALDVPPGVIFDRDGLKITAFEVEHMPIDPTTRALLPLEGQTFGYRIDYAGRSVAFSGDTRPSENLVQNARGVDVLVHEVQVPSASETKESKFANLSLSVHTEPADAGRVFARVRPRMAIYSHIVPPDAQAKDLKAATPYDGPLTVAHDLMMVTIGQSIEIADRPRVKGEIYEKAGVLK